MKHNLAVRLCAFALLLTYLVSVGGINVHHCSHTGETFVGFLFEGTDCRIIHGGSDHGCSCCGHHHDHHCDGAGDCCHNDSARLVLTGDGDHSMVSHISAPASSVITCFSVPETVCVRPALCASAPGTGPGSLPDILSVVCVLRI